jgi:hypothetical protein
MSEVPLYRGVLLLMSEVPLYRGIIFLVSEVPLYRGVLFLMSGVPLYRGMLFLMSEVPLYRGVLFLMSEVPLYAPRGPPPSDLYAPKAGLPFFVRGAKHSCMARCEAHAVQAEHAGLPMLCRQSLGTLTIEVPL